MTTEVKDKENQVVEGESVAGEIKQVEGENPKVPTAEPAAENVVPEVPEELRAVGVEPKHEEKDKAELNEAAAPLEARGEKIEGLGKPLDYNNPGDEALDLINDVKGDVSSGRRWRILTDAINALRRFVLGGRKITDPSNVIHAEHRFGKRTPETEQKPQPEKAK